MRDPLDILIAERRREKAPIQVLDTVRERIRSERPKPVWPRPLGIAAATCLAVVVHALTLSPKKGEPQLTAYERAEVLDQTVTSLAVIADALQRAGASSVETFLQASAPPIRDGLKSVKQRLIEPFKI